MISTISRNKKQPKEHHSRLISQNQQLTKARNNLSAPNRIATAYRKTTKAHRTNSRNQNRALAGLWSKTRSKSRCRSKPMTIDLNWKGNNQDLRIWLKAGRINRRNSSWSGKIRLGCVLLRLPSLAIGASWFRLLSITKERMLIEWSRRTPRKLLGSLVSKLRQSLTM